MVERDAHRHRRCHVGTTPVVDRNKAVVLYTLVDKAHDKSLPDHRAPKTGVVVLPCAEPFELVVSVTFHLRGNLARKHRHKVVYLELVANGRQSLDHEFHLLLRLNLGLGIHTVVATAAVGLGILLAEIVQKRLAAAHRTLGIRHRLEQQQLAYFLLGQRLALHELLQFLYILIAVERQTMALSAVAPRASGLLIIPFERLGYVVMDHISHVRLVDAHAEGYRSHDDVDTLHKEIVLIACPRLRIHAGMVRQSLDAVRNEQFGQLLDFFAAQTVDDAALAGALLDETYDIPLGVELGPYLVKEVRTVERRLEYSGIRHSQILLYIHLYLGRGRSRECNKRRLPDIVYDGAYAAVLGTEIVPPFRYAVGLVYGIERYLDLAQERHIVLLRKGFGGEIQQLGLSGQHIAAHLVYGRLVERRIEKMRYTRLGGECAHGIHLILHQRDQRRDNDGDPVHEQRGQLVTQRFTAARRHQYECIASCQKIPYNRFLITLERGKPEVLLELIIQNVVILLHHYQCFIRQRTAKK